MLGRTHQIIGITAGMGVFLAVSPVRYQPATFAAALVVSHFLALLPDIDQPLTDFWRMVPVGRYVGKLPALFLRHRNLTHSILGGVLVWYGLGWLGYHAPAAWSIDATLVRIAGMAAYVSHLIADMVTAEGIPLLFPRQHMYGIPPKPFEGVRIITGRWFENLVVFPLANLAFVLLIIGYWDVILTMLMPK